MTPVPSPAPSASPTPVALPAFFRVVALACRADRLALAGGGVLRVDPATPCPPTVAGRAFVVKVGTDGVVTAIASPAPSPSPLPAAKIPASAYAIAPSERGAIADDEAVTVTVVVDVPARTPPGDDIYLSTERSSWSPTELRMSRVDVRRWSAQLRLRRGARFAFRISRGSYATLERDAARQIPPPHVTTATDGTSVHVDVAAWGDID